MKSITLKLVVGTLTSMAAMGMTGGAAFAVSFNEARDKAVYAAEERQRQAGNIMTNPEAVAGKILSRVSYARAAAGNVAREAQR